MKLPIATRMLVVGVLACGVVAAGGCSEGPVVATSVTEATTTPAQEAGRIPPPCPVFGFDATATRLETSIILDTDSVPTGSVFSGTVTFMNGSSEPVGFPNHGSVTAVLFAPGTDKPVAVYTEPVQAGLHSLEVPAGGTAELALVGGTAPCGQDSEDELSPGTYDVRFPLVTHLSEPVSITVTN